jgi:hypothetical protein
MSSQDCYPDKAPVIDSVLDTLSNNIRREVINYFEISGNGETAQLEQVATHISRRIPSKDSEELKHKLHHQHLPILEENDWLEYDVRQGDIRYDGKENAKHLIEEVHEIF